MKFNQIFTALAVTTLMAGTPALHSAEVGQPAPSFTLTDTNGTEHALSDFSGKVVVLEWVNHGCPFVKKFYASGNMQAVQKAHTDKDVVWLKITSAAEGKQGHMTPEEWNTWNAGNNVAATATLIDADGTVGRAYDAKVTPHMFVIDAKGVLVYNGAIDSIKSTNPADIEKADNYVVSAVDAVLAGEEVATPVTAPYGCSVKY